MDQSKTITVTLRETGFGAGTMQIEWGGNPDAEIVYMGTDELMTLTPEETRLRDALEEKIIATVAARKARNAPKPKGWARVLPFVLRKSCFALAGACAAIGVSQMSRPIFALSPSGIALVIAAAAFVIFGLLLKRLDLEAQLA